MYGRLSLDVHANSPKLGDEVPETYEEQGVVVIGPPDHVEDHVNEHARLSEPEPARRV